VELLVRRAVQELHTAPPPGEPARFVVYGDVRSGHDTHADILGAIMAEAPDYIVSTGDLVLRGSDEADWQKFFTIASPLLARFPVYPAIGNHDMGKAGYAERRFEDIFELWPAPKARPVGAAWYSFDVGAVHWVMLDSNMYDDARQLDWLELDLQRARESGARAIFAAVHHGPWSRGPHGGSTIAVEKYVPLLEKYGTTMVFSGHDHLYQRGQVGDLRYVVTGGGGAPLYKPSCKKKGRKPCAVDGADISVAEYHFVTVEVFDDHGRLCPRRKDGTLLEACVDFPLAE
jgi:acid phosphatase type 7